MKMSENSGRRSGAVLDAAVRLGKIDREEAREIWEDFRNEEEGEDEEAFEEGNWSD